MLNAAREYIRRYDYFHPNFRRARAAVRTWARGVCQGCGFGPAVEVHHVDLRYPPAATITPDRLAAFCPLCHRVITLLRAFLSVGGDPARFLAILAGGLQKAGDTVPRTGRPRRIAGRWGTYVGGRSRPRVGEVIKVTFRDGGWACFTVTAVVDGEPGRWRVRTRWTKARKPCSNRTSGTARVQEHGSWPGEAAADPEGGRGQ